MALIYFFLFLGVVAAIVVDLMNPRPAPQSQRQILQVGDMDGGWKFEGYDALEYTFPREGCTLFGYTRKELAEIAARRKEFE